MALFAHIIGGSAVILMMMQVTANAFLRRLAGTQVPLTFEVSQWWYMPVLACAGIVIAEVHREHFYVDLIYDQLSVTGRRLLGFVATFITLLAVLALAVFTLREALDAAGMRAYETVTGIPVWPVYFAPPLAFSAFTLLLLARLYRITVSGQAARSEASVEEVAQAAVQHSTESPS